jgi:magnesium chelatase family protein
MRHQGDANRRRLSSSTALATSDARELLACAAEQLGLSARAYHRVLRVARTIADLSDEETTTAAHVAEALRFRPVSARDGDRIAALTS